MVSPEGGTRGEASGPGREVQGSEGVRGGGQGGSTKLSGTFKGDMHEVPAYPLHEERGRLGVEARSRVMTPLRVPSQAPPRVSGGGR